jgi:hypothetical protein
MAEDPVPSEPLSAKFPCNREKYRGIQAISAGTVAIEFAQNAIPEAILQSLRPCLMENRTGNSNRHNRDSIGQIKDTTRGQIREDQHKEFDQDLTNNILCLNVS